MPRRISALKGAYSIKAQEDKIKIIEDFSLDEPKTREVAGILHALGIDTGKTMFLVGSNDDMLNKSSRNISGLNLQTAENANIYDLMNSDVLLFTKSAVDKVKTLLLG